MKIIIFFLGFFVFFASYRFFIINLYRNYFKHGKSGDASGHLVIIKQFKKDFFSDKVDQFVIPNRFHYASGFHKFASIFPLTVLERFSFLPNLILFAIFTSLFFITLFLIPSINNSILILTLILFITSTSNLFFIGPSITFINLSERLLSKMTSAGYFFMIILYLDHGIYLLGVLAIILGAINLISSTFGRQLLMFVTPIFSILSLDYVPLTIFVGSFLTAICIQPKFFLKSFIGTIKYWHIYNVYIKPINMNNMIRYLDISFITEKLRNKEILKLAGHIVSSEPTKILFFFPHVVGSFIFIFFIPHKLISILFCSFLIVYIATSMYRFAHLGESYRYLEYGTYFISPYAIAITVYSIGSYVPLIYYFIYLLSVSIILFFYNNRATVSNKEDLLSKFIKDLNLKSNDVVFGVSARICMDIAARVNTKVFWWQPGGIIDPTQYQEYFERYPYLKRDWTKLFEKHSVTHVIVDKQSLLNSKIEYDFSGLQMIKESQKYIAYKNKSNNKKLSAK